MNTKVALSDEQEAVISAVKAGHNVLVTGPAGTGKSEVYRTLSRIYRWRMPVTATTGIAAVNVGGVTLHSWAGLGLAQGNVRNLISRVRDNLKAQSNIQSAELLAIDEISMLPGSVFTKLDLVMRAIRECDKPFGGVQLVMFGDFLQLPPVIKGADAATDGFAFETQSWKDAAVKLALLTKVFRQEDADFAQALNDIRVGEVSPVASKILNSRYRVKDESNDGIVPVVIHTHNVDVDAYNMAKLNALSGEEKEFLARDEGRPWAVKQLENNCPGAGRIVLRIGAQVMLLANIETESGLANGSLGVVEAFKPSGVLVKFANGQSRILEHHTWEVNDGGRVVASRRQIPLRLAWAITAHKSQGATLDKIEVHLSKSFEYGQAYVALSRVRTAGGLFIESGNKKCIRAHPAALEFYRNADRVAKVELEKTSEPDEKKEEKSNKAEKAA